MDQKISVFILDKRFNLTAPTPELEAQYRMAAEAINKRFNAYSQSHPGKTAQDLLSMVALNEACMRIKLQKELEQQGHAQNQLDADLKSYLEGLDKK